MAGPAAPPHKLSFISHFSSFSLIHRPSSSFSRFFICRSNSPPSSLLLPHRPRRNSRLLAVIENEKKTNLEAVDFEEDGRAIGGSVGAVDERKRRARPCELYVCNLPRIYEISNLLELFKHYGTVLSVEVSRDPQTGISRGCGFVTMASISEAKLAINALDGSDIGGREMRVKFSVDMVSNRKNVEALNSAPKKSIVFESPYKIYVGNLSRSIRAQELMEYFSRFGKVISTRVLHDRKNGKSRAYAFISYSTIDEVMVAAEANGSEFCGRIMSVREVIDQSH
ncbi:31 kDa ribonucleoprotein, chloroplastic-like [Phalaenopsis equestris]|uniref:31 kDa ribonucleoprotein, chloroplastic-like n=1 Tax=Phalaenopsis equestris TaxID=78828 RepID=UPI0009E1B2D7|nr:31 kDa ribonucleoprotein, chloroplastic-like [Phalaenopsis equestris]